MRYDLNSQVNQSELQGAPLFGAMGRIRIKKIKKKDKALLWMDHHPRINASAIDIHWCDIISCLPPLLDKKSTMVNKKHLQMAKQKQQRKHDNN